MAGCTRRSKRKQISIFATRDEPHLRLSFLFWPLLQVGKIYALRRVSSTGVHNQCTLYGRDMSLSQLCVTQVMTGLGS